MQIDKEVLFIALANLAGLVLIVNGHRMIKKYRRPVTIVEHEGWMVGWTTFIGSILLTLLLDANCLILTPTTEGSFKTVVIDTVTYKIGEGVVLTRPQHTDEVVDVVGIGLQTETYPQNTYREPSNTLTCFVRPGIDLNVGDRVLVFRTEVFTTTRSKTSYLAAQKKKIISRAP